MLDDGIEDVEEYMTRFIDNFQMQNINKLNKFNSNSNISSAYCNEFKVKILLDELKLTKTFQETEMEIKHIVLEVVL